ncbi:MAG: class I SAM-dependent methyltransferase [Candidatus ainarchaeum sp.]|nr:class I SAM-dependent methyltransferase [Candidatus ainarchaeum sp.]
MQNKNIKSNLLRKVLRVSTNPLTVFRTEVSRKTILGRHTVRQYSPNQFWGFEHSNLSQVQANLKFNLVDHISNSFKSTKSPVVVDFGCGMGTALASLSQRKELLGAKFYGFADLLYKEWFLSDREKVNFIHGTVSDFNRYFKSNSVDLIYSHKGLKTVPNSPIYIFQMLSCLRKNGKLVTDLSFTHRKQFIDIFLKKELISLDGHNYKIEQINTEQNKDGELIITRIN